MRIGLNGPLQGIRLYLLISKLHAYGMSTPSLTLIASYLLERKQRVKLRGCVSDWTTITKGVPQGSVLGPLLFNLFLNDIYFTNSTAELYNYADDNTICASGAKIFCVLKQPEIFLRLRTILWRPTPTNLNLFFL